MASSGNFSGDIAIAVTKAFRERTGIQLEILSSLGSANIERIKTEKRYGQMVTDLVSASPIQLKLLKSEGLLAVETDMPVFQERDTWLVNPLNLDPKGQMLAYERVWTGPYVNTKLVKEAEWPTSLFDLLKPAWKGKMVMSDPRTGSGVYRYYIPFVRLGIIDWEYLKAFGRQEVMLVKNNRAAIVEVAKGAVLFTPMGTSGPNAAIVQEGAPVKALSMKEGDLFDVNAFSAVEGSPHPNAAKVFINWFFSKEGQTMYANVAQHGPLRKDTPNFVPKEVIPPNPSVRKIEITDEDSQQAENLLREGFIAKLMGLQR